MDLKMRRISQGEQDMDADERLIREKRINFKPLSPDPLTLDNCALCGRPSTHEAFCYDCLQAIKSDTEKKNG